MNANEAYNENSRIQVTKNKRSSTTGDAFRVLNTEQDAHFSEEIK